MSDVVKTYDELLSLIEVDPEGANKLTDAEIEKLVSIYLPATRSPASAAKVSTNQALISMLEAQGFSLEQLQEFEKTHGAPTAPTRRKIGRK